MEYILLTGGLGYIGSHIALNLLEHNYNVILIDNLSNSRIEIFNKIQNISNLYNERLKFYDLGLCNSRLSEIFSKNKINNVIHLAGFKSVNESIKKPLEYYANNIDSTLNLLFTMEKYQCFNLIFSSSCTIYGNNKSPLTEKSKVGINITNPYGKTKYFIENILMDLSNSDNKWKIISLRYFNPLGCHKSGLLGEDPLDIPNNLMPYILKTAYNNNISKKFDKEFNILKIFGNNYNTKDGTCIRDYIHVLDLSEAHYNAVEKIEKVNGYKYYNVGTGKGYTVLELVNKFIEINNVAIPYKFIERRVGDLGEVYCDNSLIKEELNFECKYLIEDMCKDSWNYIIKNTIT